MAFVCGENEELVFVDNSPSARIFSLTSQQFRYVRLISDQMSALLISKLDLRLYPLLQHLTQCTPRPMDPAYFCSTAAKARLGFAPTIIRPLVPRMALRWTLDLLPLTPPRLPLWLIVIVPTSSEWIWKDISVDQLLSTSHARSRSFPSKSEG